VIKPDDLPLGGPQALAWPFDPASNVTRDGNRLNQVLVLRLDPGELDDDTKARSANGIVAYSAVCAHAGCVVSAWMKDDSNTVNKDVLKCLCHNSEYDPRQGAEVVFGPAPRHLAALPLAMEGKELTIAGGFVGKVGPQQAT
jgi:Rieske Fe-S protein